MADQKNQHFVPKAHFKPFSWNGEANSINIFNIRSQRVVNNASISGRGSKNYFYGKDKTLEMAFNSIEGRYATIIRSLEIGDPVFDKGYLRDLRSFMFIQFLRTEQALKRTDQSNREMADVVFRGVDETERPPLLTKEEILAISMSIFVERHDIIDDLKMVIVRNNTPYEFYASDDPAVLTNRYHIRGDNRTNFGLTNSGAIFVLPLSPDKLFLCCDGFVCTIPGKVEFL